MNMLYECDLNLYPAGGGCLNLSHVQKNMSII